MGTLIFITSRFPFTPGESFIESEFPFLYSNFSRIIIIARNVSASKSIALPDDVNIYRYNPTSTVAGYMTAFVILTRNIKRIKEIYFDEIRFRNEIMRPINYRQKLFLLKKIMKGLQLKTYIEKIISKEKIEGVITFYSYWLNNGAHAISMLDQNKKIKIARAHRIDLYEEDTDNNYLPLLKYMSQKLDAIFFISDHGKEYFENRMHEIHSKNQVSKLGIINPFIKEIQKADSKFFQMVSCSSLIMVKRIDLIISALENLKTDKKIQWNHFGDGNLRSELIDLAHRKLGALENVRFEFMGQVPNSELMEFYKKNKVDLFINTSSSEGIPVSIMEAQSFGIPVIATDVGGLKELVIEGTGELIPVNISPEYLAERIQYYINMSEEESVSMRHNAFNNWNLKYNALFNYMNFIEKVNTILASYNFEFRQIKV